VSEWAKAMRRICTLTPSRSMREWAEQEIVIPNGPRRGIRYSTAYAPWTGLLLDAMEDPQWSRIWAAGSVQSGKTLTAYCIPTLYTIFELGESVICGVPDIKLAQGIYEERLLPVIRETRYRDLLPVRGAGSRGGSFEAVTFRNGATLRFMGAGAGDAQRSSHTARTVVITEVDKMDTARAASREADPIRQLEARTTAFGDRAKLFAECTVSVEEGRIWEEITLVGSNTRIFIPCPKCGRWFYPDRANLVGWMEASSVLEARDKTRTKCPACSELLDDEDRMTALESPRFVHGTQSVSKKNKIVGKEPPTRTLGVRWTAWHSPMLTTADLGERHWLAARTGSDSDERALCQFVWAVPYRDEFDDEKLTPTLVRSRTGMHAWGRLPEGAGWRVTCGVDIQKDWNYFTFLAGRMDEGVLTCAVLAAGTCDFIPKSERQSGVSPPADAIRATMDRLLAYADSLGTDSIWMDVNYDPDGVLRAWANEHGNVFALRGRGHRKHAAQLLGAKRMKGRAYRVGDGRIVHALRGQDRAVWWSVDVDQSRLAVHRGFGLEPGEVGSICLPRLIPRTRSTEDWLEEWERSSEMDLVPATESDALRRYAQHICNEQFLTVREAGKGDVKKWVTDGRRHDWLDTTGYAWAGQLYEWVGPNAEKSETGEKSLAELLGQ